jgi:hypothetical protein
MAAEILKNHTLQVEIAETSPVVTRFHSLKAMLGSAIEKPFSGGYVTKSKNVLKLSVVLLSFLFLGIHSAFSEEEGALRPTKKTEKEFIDAIKKRILEKEDAGGFRRLSKKEEKFERLVTAIMNGLRPWDPRMTELAREQATDFLEDLTSQLISFEAGSEGMLRSKKLTSEERRDLELGIDRLRMLENRLGEAIREREGGGSQSKPTPLERMPLFTPTVRETSFIIQTTLAIYSWDQGHGLRNYLLYPPY